MFRIPVTIVTICFLLGGCLGTLEPVRTLPAGRTTLNISANVSAHPYVVPWLGVGVWHGLTNGITGFAGIYPVTFRKEMMLDLGVAGLLCRESGLLPEQTLGGSSTILAGTSSSYVTFNPRMTVTGSYTLGENVQCFLRARGDSGQS